MANIKFCIVDPLWLLAIKSQNTKFYIYLVEGIFAVLNCCIQIRYVAGKTTLEKVNIGCLPGHVLKVDYMCLRNNNYIKVET